MAKAMDKPVRSHPFRARGCSRLIGDSRPRASAGRLQADRCLCPIIVCATQQVLEVCPILFRQLDPGLQPKSPT